MAQGLVFSDTTNKAGLIQDCEVLLGFDDTAISANSTLLKRFTVLLNLARRKAEILILQAMNPLWTWDDPNYSDLPRATQTLVHGQKDYSLPTVDGTYSAANAEGLLTIQEISILDAAGNEKKLEPTNLTEAELDLLYATDGQPQVYKLKASSVKVWPGPASGYVTTTAGLLASFTRIGKDFASSGDDTQTPGIPVPFQRLLSLEACLDYASSRPSLKDKLNYLQEKHTELTALMEDHFANRLRDNFPPRIRRRPRQNHF